MMKQNIYMAVTTDKYELPLALETSYEELSKITGVSVNSIKYSIYKHLSGRHRGIKFIKVKIDTDD